ncbi:MAG: hypothetical protein GXO75_14420 [Calditrichaeota bacterium]|nr:hypothetical protein [Calditrichota bacterium]
MIDPGPDIKIGDQDSFRYESLRSRVLEKDEDHGKGSLGLAMFLRQGMLSWISTWHKCIPVNFSTGKQTHPSPVLPFKVQSEMTRVLANMTLFSLGEFE